MGGDQHDTMADVQGGAGLSPFDGLPSQNVQAHAVVLVRRHIDAPPYSAPWRCAAAVGVACLRENPTLQPFGLSADLTVGAARRTLCDPRGFIRMPTSRRRCFAAGLRCAACNCNTDGWDRGCREKELGGRVEHGRIVAGHPIVSSSRSGAICAVCVRTRARVLGPKHRGQRSLSKKSRDCCLRACHRRRATVQAHAHPLPQRLPRTCRTCPRCGTTPTCTTRDHASSCCSPGLCACGPGSRQPHRREAPPCAES